MDWFDRSVKLLLSASDLKDSPEIDTKTELNRAFEQNLVEFHKKMGNQWREKQKRLVKAHKKEQQEMQLS